MKKIIALALALIMALSMASVAFAANTELTAVDTASNPGNKVTLLAGTTTTPNVAKREWKISYDFTSAKDDYAGASMIESIAWEKDNDLVLTLKENLTSTTEKEINGLVTLTSKTADDTTCTIKVTIDVANIVDYIEGSKKAVDADDVSAFMLPNHVMYAEDGAGYVEFKDNSETLVGLVKVAKDEKAQVYIEDKDQTTVSDEDLVDAVEEYLGEDYDAIVEWYNFCGTGFKADVDFTYDAWAEDPHYFYAWDGEKFVDLEAKYNDDEDVEKYEFTAPAKGLIIVTDVEIVAAAEEETKNPDTGANDVVGVAAALAVVSLVAAGAVSLKK